MIGDAGRVRGTVEGGARGPPARPSAPSPQHPIDQRAGRRRTEPRGRSGDCGAGGQGVALGAHPQTFQGLSGIGDLMVTCMSPQSRNRTVGERLGRGETLAQILEGMEQVAEGVWTCGTALALAREAGVEAPVMVQVDAILHQGRKPRDAVAELMGRDPRAERD